MLNWAAFLSYIFLTAFTPGPNNIMAMSTSSKYGLKRGLYFCTGVFGGFLVVMTCCSIFSALLVHLIPKIEPFMVYIGAAYILWLAWTIYRDKPKKNKSSENEQEESTKVSTTIFTGMVLQFINVKVILYGITAISTFVLPYYKSIPSLGFFVLILSLMGFAGTFCWALFGAIFERVFKEHKKGLNIVMALLLVYCAISIILS